MISEQDLYEAYRKFKTFVYHNGQTLSLRSKLAKFEDEMLNEDDRNQANAENFKRKFIDKTKPLLEVLNNTESDQKKKKFINSVFDGWLKTIKYKVIPKQLAENHSTSEHFITNEVPMGNFVVEKCNYFIDAPIELYLISTLWTLMFGRRLSNYISNDNYAYRLSIFKGLDDPNPEDPDKSEIYKTVSSGLALYDPYFIGYQEWRDNGLNKVSQVLEKGENAVLLSLDIKRYFYNVKINVIEIVKFYLKDVSLSVVELKICELLQSIHERYASLFPKVPEEENDQNEYLKNTVMLPIGLPSSGLLGNLTLKPFDDYIRNRVTPTYYGRYVDDIILVFSGKGLKLTKHPESGSFIDGFICEHLLYAGGDNTTEDQDLKFTRHLPPPLLSYYQANNDNGSKKESTPKLNLEKDSLSSINYLIEIKNSKFCLQLDKVIMEYFNCKGSTAGINKFKKQLEKNRSEFRYLPWEEEINLEFDDEAFRLEVTESVNKLRNLEGISEDKYGASKYLAKKIFLSTLPFESPSRSDSEASAKQILTYFKGRTAILMNSLWEKVATYFVLNNEPKYLEIFWKQASIAIEKVKEGIITSEKNIPSVKTDEIKAFLKEHLTLSIAMAISIVPDILHKCFRNKKENEELGLLAEKFRKTYLFRHQYQYLKGYCYTLEKDNR